MGMLSWAMGVMRLRGAHLREVGVVRDTQSAGTGRREWKVEARNWLRLVEHSYRPSLTSPGKAGC